MRYYAKRVQVWHRPAIRCGKCGATVATGPVDCRVARWRGTRCSCGVVLKPRPVAPARKPKRGSDERVKEDLRHATRKVDEWTDKVSRATAQLKSWRRKERQLWDRVVEGPPPPRPKRKRRAGRRTLELED